MGTVVAGHNNLRRILLVNAAQDSRLCKPKFDTFLTESCGKAIRNERADLGEVCWIPLLPPDRPGPYFIRFCAGFEDGSRLEAQDSLKVIADKSVH
jgi:hypothetical protein